MITHFWSAFCISVISLRDFSYDNGAWHTTLQVTLLGAVSQLSCSQELSAGSQNTEGVEEEIFSSLTYTPGERSHSQSVYSLRGSEAAVGHTHDIPTRSKLSDCRSVDGSNSTQVFDSSFLILDTHDDLSTSAYLCGFSAPSTLQMAPEGKLGLCAASCRST